MKRILIGVAAGALCLGVAMAQSDGNVAPNAQSPATQSPSTQPQPSAPAPSGPVTRIAPGSVIPVALTRTIDAKKAKSGEEVVAKVTQDMKSNSGEVIVAKDTKVVGHVTEAQARSKDQKQSELGIAFDHAVMNDGRTLTMPMSIQAVVGPQNNNNNGQNNQEGSASASAPAPTSTSTGGARGGMGGSGASAANQAPQPATSGGTPSDNPSSTSARPAITAQTQGVIGISNLSLTSTAANASDGSVLTYEKNNVKIESGTMILLRVSQ
jgi:hypothetical protein